MTDRNWEKWLSETESKTVRKASQSHDPGVKDLVEIITKLHMKLEILSKDLPPHIGLK